MSKDVHNVKVKIFEYNSFFDICNIFSRLLLQHKISL